jgi:adenylate cyclase
LSALNPEYTDQDSSIVLKQVLLVDDNPTNLQVLCQALEEQGYELLVAQSGAEALETAAAARPALILLDINMPGMDGFETCRRLRAGQETKDCVIIFLSARDSVHDKVEGLRLGAVDYVSKPFQFEEVVARVNTQLELKRAREELRIMHEKADALLLNVFPRSVAERLKRHESKVVDYVPQATIIFCDLVGFTPLAAQQKPEELVDFLNRVFIGMDELVERHGLTKIKTIGDAYMASAGVPDPRSDHAGAVADFALAVMETIPSLCEAEGCPLDLRIGIHSGPVVAGVIGEKRFAYDLWGDTVNTASRMESSGEPGRIQISPDTRAMLGDGWEVEPRGEVEIRGKGRMQTYFLTGKRECSGENLVETA